MANRRILFTALNGRGKAAQTEKLTQLKPLTHCRCLETLISEMAIGA